MNLARLMISIGRDMMTKFIGEECPYCNNEFTSDDDIVVCPECGAPYHRNCYKLIGHCVFENKHTVGEVWKSKNKEFANEKKVCPHCKCLNNIDALFCEKCGLNLEKDDSRAKSDDSFHKNPNSSTTEKNLNSKAIFSLMLDPLGGINKNEDFEGLSAVELADYVGSSSSYYMPQFKKIKDKEKYKFNFSAFLFSSLWFFYRKQYLKGIIVAIVLSIFSVYDLICNLAYLVEPSYQITRLGLVISYVSYFLYLGSKVLISIHANKIYYKHCIKKIKKIKLKLEGNEKINLKLKSGGGVSFCSVAVYMLISAICTYGILYFFM